ncbi:uncharacterized protein LOC144453079 [Glandiceps talaboti]
MARRMMNVRLSLSWFCFAVALTILLVDTARAEDDTNKGRSQVLQNWVKNLKIEADKKPQESKRYKWVIPGMGGGSGSGRKRSESDDRDIGDLLSALQERLYKNIQQLVDILDDFEDVEVLLRKTKQAKSPCEVQWQSGVHSVEC